MLLRFRAANHLSLWDEQEISLVASPLSGNETSLIDSSALPKERILPGAMIYGANASGKSNVIYALLYMREAVLFSHNKGQPGGSVPRIPFALDQLAAKKPSLFDADFVAEGVRYNYGFEVSDKTFPAEWLYAFPNHRRLTLFERKDGAFKFGSKLKGHNKILSDLTRPNSLFLSAAVQNHHEQLSAVSAFFHSQQFYTDITVPDETATRHVAQDEPDKRIIEFLYAIGTGIVGFRHREHDVPSEIRSLISTSTQTEINRTLKVEDADGIVATYVPEIDKFAIFELGHRVPEDDPVYLSLDRESAGTRRLLVLLDKVFQALDNGTLLVVDELDASLHTTACEAVLELFFSPETNPHGAQIMATTHDTNLMQSPLLRRDQTWFTEKDKGGATHLYPLTDIRTRQSDNIEKGYLQGRYGAISFPPAMSKILAAE